MKESLHNLKLHESIKIDDNLRIQRVPGGWNYIYTLVCSSGIDTKIVNVPYSAEFKEKPKQPKQPKQPELGLVIENDLAALIRFWNSKRITHCRLQSKKLELVFTKRLKESTKDEIREAVNNYAEVIHSDSFFKTKWGLETFLKQSNGVPHFHNNGEKWLSYKDEIIQKEEKEPISEAERRFREGR